MKVDDFTEAHVERVGSDFTDPGVDIFLKTQCLPSCSVSADTDCDDQLVFGRPS
jgi:hypothetical protein